MQTMMLNASMSRLPATTRREFFGVLVAAGLVTACGTSAGPSGGGDTRTVSDSFGEQQVPATPQRVVSLSFQVTAALLEVGIVPVAAATTAGFFGESAYHPALYSRGIGDATGLEYPYALEQLATLEPDLIVGEVSVIEDTGREPLLGIAPTLATESDGFRSQLAAVGDIVGKPQEATAALGRLDGALASFAAQPLMIETVSMVTAINDGSLFVVAGNDAATLITGLGLTALPSEAGDAALSEEQIGILEGDALVRLMRSTPGALEAFRRLEANPLYMSLPAVQAGRVFDVEDAALNGFGGIDAIIPALETLVAGLTS